MDKNKMLNKLIQSTEADISKFAMLECYEEVVKTRATKFIDINFNEPDNFGSAKEIGYFSYHTGFLAGLEVALDIEDASDKKLEPILYKLKDLGIIESWYYNGTYHVKGGRQMDKDEMKNKISFALKDPILQQGFEIICKNLAELEKENAELKRDKEDLIFIRNQKAACMCEDKEQLAKAKELIKKLLDVAKFYNYYRDKGAVMDITPIYEAEQFLKEVKE